MTEGLPAYFHKNREKDCGKIIFILINQGIKFNQAIF